MSAAILLCLLALVTPCLAQRSMRAVLVAVGDTPLANCVLYAGATALPLDLPRRNLSQPTALPDGDLTICALPKPLAEGEAVPAGAPKARIPADWARCILVFTSDPANKVLPVKIHALDGSDGKVPAGHTILVNCTHATITARFGTIPVTCKPGETVGIKPPREDDGEYNIAIDCIYPGETVVRPVCRSSWNHNPKVKQFLFATPDPNRKLPHIWGVNDLPSIKPPESPEKPANPTPLPQP